MKSFKIQAKEFDKIRLVFSTKNARYWSEKRKVNLYSILSYFYNPSTISLKFIPWLALTKIISSSLQISFKNFIASLLLSK